MFILPSKTLSTIHRTQIYSTLLVFVTQKLSTRRDLQTHQTLTATHDNAAAWTGLGSAVSSIWNQRAIPASIMGVVSVFLYLANILVLHITTPALFSLDTFNASHQLIVQTEGLPTINQSLGL
jgi:maltodextrin utilization protein YvdJ